MAKGERSEVQVMKPGRERGKAWIYSVINPLLEALKTEDFFLLKRNWTFRRYNRDLEFILPIAALVDYQSRPNWEDFISSNPEIKERVQGRDACRETLKKACGDAFDFLVAIPGFRRRVEESIETFGADAAPVAGELVHPNVKPHEVIAELVVNNIVELPSHYGLYRFWSMFNHELMPFRVGEQFDRADEAGIELRKSNDELAAELTSARSALAAEYDIPWAPYYDESLSLPSR
jgi:hypothetical protein